MKKTILSVFLTLALLTGGFGTRPARAAVTWTVNSLNDPGNGYCDLVECTLREAVSVAGPTDTIDFSVTGAIYLDSQLAIGIPLNIVGPGATDLIVSGGFVTRVFSVNSPSVAVNISGITIADGYITGAPVNDGAGVYNLGILNLDEVILDYNTSSGANGGGAIYNGSHATLSVTDSTFTDNFSPTRGGAIANYGSLNVTNSTFSGNIADNGSGGGIFNLGYLTVNNATFSDNASTANGSGIYNGIATLVLKNSIIANGTGADCYNAATLKPPSGTGNLIETNAAGQNACGAPTATGEPMLASLDYNGGSTPTFGLLAGSPALDSAHDPSCASFDQRGVSRPQGAHCDIGAFEALPAPTVTVEQTVGQPDPTDVSPIHFTVTFSQPVTGFTSADVVLGGSAGASAASVSGTGPTYDVAVSGMTGNGAVVASVNANAAFNADGLGNLASASVDNMVTYQVLAYPSVQSSVRADSNPTSAASVDFAVTFNQSVTGVDVSDFAITASGLANTSVLSVSGSGAVYTVTVDTGLGSGSLRLDVIDDDSIVNGSSVPLGDVGLGNGNFLTGESYAVNKLLTFISAGAQDGWIFESAENSAIGGSINANAGTFNLGDDAARRQFRAILSFNTSSLPDGAVIIAARLKVKLQSVKGGGDPFLMFGGMIVDIKKGFFGTSGALQAADFQAAASASQAPLSPAPVSSWYAFDLDSALFPHVNLLAGFQSGLTQLRLRFNLDDNNNNIANYISFFSGNATTVANRPVLEVYYYVP